MSTPPFCVLCGLNCLLTAEDAEEKKEKQVKLCRRGDSSSTLLPRRLRGSAKSIYQ